MDVGGMLDSECQHRGAMLDNEHWGKEILEPVPAGRASTKHGGEADPLLTYGPAAPPAEEGKALSCRRSQAQETPLCSHAS